MKRFLPVIAFLALFASALSAVVMSSNSARAGNSLSASGIVVITDPETGCEYLTTTHAASPLTPRMQANGTQLCRNK